MAVRSELLTPLRSSTAAATPSMHPTAGKRTLVALVVALLALPLLGFVAEGLVPVGALVAALVLGAFLAAAVLYFASVLALLGAFQGSSDGTHLIP